MNIVQKDSLLLKLLRVVYAVHNLETTTTAISQLCYCHDTGRRR